MIITIATLTSKPEEQEDLAGMLAQLAAASRNDPGCISYSFHVDIEDPTTFRSIEMWESEDQMNAHMQTPHVGEAIAGAPDLLSADLQIDSYPVSS